MKQIDIITIDRMKKDKILWPTYRVEIQKKQDINETDFSNYRYYSFTYGHHIYFLTKRIMGYIEKKYDIPPAKQLNNIDLIIKLLELDSTTESNLILHHLFTLNELREIILQNAYTNKKRHHQNALELCDTKKYDGGFGISDEWRKLFYYLTLCEEKIPLNNTDLIIYFESLKEKLRYQKINIAKNQAAKETIKEAIKIKQPPICVSKILDNSETETKISSLITSLYNNSLLNPESNLAKNKEQSIQLIQGQYKEAKSLILTKSTTITD